jgi:hypothetical protein
MTTTAPDDLFLALDPRQIDRLPWVPLPSSTGAVYKVLWCSPRAGDAAGRPDGRAGRTVQTLVHYHEGGRSRGEAHPDAEHHVWVVSGAATIAGQRLGAGSFAHIPPGLAHPTTDGGPEGATLLILYRPAG